MIAEADLYLQQLTDIIQSAAVPISNIRPSDWVEKNVVMGQPFPGPYRYSKTPYVREIIDMLAADCDARIIAVMKGLQIGVSAGLIIPGMGWIIKESPGNTYFTVGAPDLINKSVEKLDLMIDNAGLRRYIRPQVQRVRAQKSGDTNTKKDFSGGFINITTPNNHKEWRDVSLKYGFVDDFEAAKLGSKESGSTRKLIEGRFAAYADTHKIFYISTPEQKATSNIEPAYLLGDQRKYMIPCPCCACLIELKWTLEKEGRVGGITWKLDDNNKLIPGSVGYICQECGGFFDDKDKSAWLLERGHGGDAFWQATAEPSRPGYYSYHISSLYAPLGMYDWEHYVNDYLEANPVGQPRNEQLYKTFVNTCLGETYEGSAEAPKANSIQKNTRNYDIGIIPERLSIADGNGPIVLLTAAADMNGVMNEGGTDDARLDYEVLAWAANGASYSVMAGSIGTFVPAIMRRKEHELADRKKWTYAQFKENSVWPVLDEILQRRFKVDSDNPRTMAVLLSGLDCGHHSTYAYAYLDTTNSPIIGVKGKGEDKYFKDSVDVKLHMPSLERPTSLYILTVGLFKDKLSHYMNLRWNANEAEQPENFMNFPQPADGLYGFATYFEHFESEHRTMVANKDGGESYRWVKKQTNSQNHFWDCRIYNLAVKEIFIWLLGKEAKNPTFGWADYAAMAGG